MTADHGALYNAYVARDARFDGVFYVGVTSTGIYCRPVCTAKTPKAANCRFFESAAAAEQAKFRPCLRCRPELAPGNAPVDDANRIANLIAQRIDEGMLDRSERGSDSPSGVEAIARQFGWSSRQIRRMMRKELGVSPVELRQTRRLLLAKQLLTETRLPVTEIAFASGFSSLRRFNDAFSSQYRMPPTRLRKDAAGQLSESNANSTATLQLSYRSPYDWEAILDFLRTRMIKEVEFISEERYLRTVRLGKSTGWVAVTHKPEKRALAVEFTHSLMPVLPALLGRLRNLFDLAA